MSKTFHMLITRLTNHSPHIVVPGRMACYEVPNQGWEMMEKVIRGEADSEEGDNEGSRTAMDDVLIELL